MPAERRPLGMVINEIDYEQPAGDEATEFIEIHNHSCSAIGLEGWRVELINGDIFPPADPVYATFDLEVATEILPAGGYLLIADQRVPTPPGVRKLLIVPDDQHSNLQNGPRDGVRLVGPEGVVDELFYEIERREQDEGVPILTPEDPEEAGWSIGRCPDGHDTDDHPADFVPMRASPGVPNDCGGVP